MPYQRASAFAASLAMAGTFACNSTPAGPDRSNELISANFETSISFAGQIFPAVQLSITASGSSSHGNAVSMSKTTVDGKAVTSPVLLDEGNHSICVTATSSTTLSTTQCRDVQLTWPRFRGRSVMYDAHGAVTPSGLTLTLDDGTTFAIANADGSFSIPSSKAQFSGAKLVFSGSGGVAPSLVRTKSNAAINVVMVPAQLTIPACSVYGGQVVSLDLEKAFADASTGQSSFFDRAGTLRTSGTVVVASWNASSIPVALSDTGGINKRFTAQDSAEVASVLAALKSYVCQDFHLASVAEAVGGGIVIVKDPGFAALGAHSMELPTLRGDYTRAEVVLRTIVPVNSAARDSTRRTIMHEFFHVLGFGHSCSWPTVMTTGTICSASTYTFVPSPQDVAHYFAMRFARQGERALSSTESLGPAYAAALVASGKAEKQLSPYFGQP